MTGDPTGSLNFPLIPVVVITLLTLAAFSYHFHLLQQASADLRPPLNRSPAADAKAEAALESMPLAQDPMAEPGRVRLDETTRSLILSCTKGSRALSGIHKHDKFISLREYLEKATRTPGQTPSETILESRNLQLLDGDGHRLRLRISKQSEPKLYGIDDETLPVLLPLPDELQDVDSMADAIDRFKSRGQVEIDEVFETLKWETGEYAQILQQDGHILSLKIVSVGGELACRSTGDHQESTSCSCF